MFWSHGIGFHSLSAWIKDGSGTAQSHYASPFNRVAKEAWTPRALLHVGSEPLRQAMILISQKFLLSREIDNARDATFCTRPVRPTGLGLRDYVLLARAAVQSLVRPLLFFC
jgi:hypothetical protein